MRQSIAIMVAGIVQDGLPVIWTSGHPSDTTWYGNTYTVRPCLISVGAFGQSIGDGESIETSSVTAFALPVDDFSAMGERPVDYFGCIGAETLTDAEVWATTGIAEGGTSLPLAANSTGIASGTMLHVGTEVVTTTAAWTSGSVSVARGQAGTQASPHRAQLSGYLARTIPVTLRPCYWVGRRVLVYVNGALWRECFIVDNPLISGNTISISMVGAENKVSIEHTAGGVPPYSTTLYDLRPTSNYLGPTYQMQWWYYRPLTDHTLYDPPPTAITGTGLSHLTIYAPDAIMLQSQYYWQAGGKTGNPRYIPIMYVGLSCPVSTPGGASHKEWCRVAQMGTWSEGYGDSGQTLSEIVLDDLTWETLLQLYPNNQVHLSSVRFCESLVQVPYTTGDDLRWWESEDSGEPVWLDIDTANQMIRCKSRVYQGLRYPYRSQSFKMILLARQNLGPDADRSLYSHTDIYTQMESQLVTYHYRGQNSDPGERDVMRPWEYGTYRIRPKGDAPQMLRCHTRSCACTAWVWTFDNGSSQWSIGCDIATKWWEMGDRAILTVAEIPIKQGRIWDDVTISWVEPDGTELQATAEVKRWSSADLGSGYGYLIRNVRMLPIGAGPCVGFGDWGQGAVTISRPMGLQFKPLSTIITSLLASGDGTTSREGDDQAAGFDLPLSGKHLASIAGISIPGIESGWSYSPQGGMSINEYLQMALLVSGQILAGKLIDGVYLPRVVDAGRPALGYSADNWTAAVTLTDDDMIGLPSSGTIGGLVYTSYKITWGDKVYNIPDWLAADLLGGGDECEIDLTDVAIAPQAQMTQIVHDLVDSLRDRFGTVRRQWTMRIPLEIGLHLAVGDVARVTSDHLISPTGEIGVSGALCRIMSIDHDFGAGVCTISATAWAEYGAVYAVSADVTLTSYSSSAHTATLTFSSSGDAATVVRKQADWDKLCTLINYDSEYKYGFVSILAGRYSGYQITGTPSVTSPTTIQLTSTTTSGTINNSTSYSIPCLLTFSAANPKPYDWFAYSTDRLL